MDVESDIWLREILGEGVTMFIELESFQREISRS